MKNVELLSYGDREVQLHEKEIVLQVYEMIDDYRQPIGFESIKRTNIGLRIAMEWLYRR